MRGIYCANAWSKRGHFLPCDGIWHGGCFTVGDRVKFPIRVPVDEEGYRIIKTKDVGRFQSARDGDHLLTEFQCPLCHFRNIYGRNPRENNALDSIVMEVYFPRAIVDGFWARESNTVRSNRLDFEKLLRAHVKFGMVRALPRLGPKPLSDLAGMSCAVSFLDRAQDPGNNEVTLQYGTARGVRTAYTNLWNVSVFGENETVAVGGKSKMHTTTSPAMGDWYTRFDKGAHKRMGDLSFQDAAWSPELLIEIMAQFEIEWEELEGTVMTNGTRRKKEAEMIFPALMGELSYVLALRGEELPLMDLAGSRINSARGKVHPKISHGVVALLGRFKNEIGEKYHLMPVPFVTNSGLKPMVWLNRMLGWYEEGGIESGPVFRTERGECAKYGDFEHEFLTRMAKVQESKPELFAKPDSNVFEEYSLGRSGRRSATGRSLNVGLDGTIIETNNRWRVRERAKGSDPNQNMIQHYADVLVLLDALLAFPQAM
jgi:hypothetical protein